MVEPRVPRVIEFARAVFARMLEEADEEGIWRGKMTELHNELGVPTNYYSKVVNHISVAADQVERGGVNRLSVWKIEKPDYDFSEEASVKLRPSKRTNESRIQALENSVGGLNIPKLIADMSLEIEVLKRQMQELSVRLGPRQETPREVIS